jgi:hypothetical protein
MDPDEFEYACMWKYYRAECLADPTDDVFVHKYSANYTAMKYDKTGETQPFVFRKMQVSALRADDPLSGPNGSFIVCDEAPLSSCLQAKKNLFFVMPREHVSASRGPFFVADHFSFMVNKGVAERKQLQFHMTVYTPFPEDLPKGQVGRVKCHMPLKFPLPYSEESFLESGLIENLRPYSPTLYPLFTRPWSSQSYQTGGTGQRRRRARRLPSSEGDFDHVWRRLPIDRLLVFGQRSRVFGWDITMIVTTRFRDGSNVEDAHVFRVRSTDDLREEIGKRFEGLDYDDFVPIPDVG